MPSDFSLFALTIYLRNGSTVRKMEKLVSALGLGEKEN